MKFIMKNIACMLSFVLAFILVFSFADINVQAASGKKKNVVVLYFSATGTTKGVAQRIQKATNGKLIEIKASNPYTDADLNYGNPDSRVVKEHASASSPAKSKVRPKISNIKTIQNAVKKADVVYIGYPIWWGEAPHIMYSMVEKTNLKGKKVVPFCTSLSSGIGNSGSHLRTRAKISSKTKWLKGRNFYQVPSQKNIHKWVKTI